MNAARQRKIGARRPIGAAMSPGRRAGLGGTRASAYEARVWSVLPVHRQLRGSRGPDPGSFSAHLSHAAELPGRIRRFSDVAYQRDAQSAGGQLPAHAAGPHDGFNRRRDAETRGEAFGSAHAGPVGASSRTERATTAWIGAAFAGMARGGYFSRFAAVGIQRDSNGAASAVGNGKIEN